MESKWSSIWGNGGKWDIMLFHSSQGSGIFGQALAQLNVISSYTYGSYAGSITLPANIQNGDLLLMTQTAGNGGSSYPAITILGGTGFTLVNSGTGIYTISTSFYRQSAAVSYKIANGTESGTVVSGFMDSGLEAAVLFHIRGDKKIKTVSHLSAISINTATDPTVYTLTTASTYVEIPYYMNGTSNNAPTIVVSPAALSSNTRTAGTYAAITAGMWKSLKTSSTYTFDSNDAGNMNVVLGGILRLA